MVLRGEIKKGKIVLDKPTALPDGTKVKVVLVKKPKGTKKKSATKPKPKSLTERFKSFIGKAKHLPPDMSVNHDHYLYGVPKQSP